MSESGKHGLKDGRVSSVSLYDVQVFNHRTMVKAKPLWGPIRTPEGFWIPGPHGVSAESQKYPGTSGGIGIIESGGEALLTDVGYRTSQEYPPGVLDTVTEIIDSQSLNVKCIIQTHFHFDHIGNTQYIKERYNAPVYCHPHEQAVLKEPMMTTRTDYFESIGADPEQIAADLTLEHFKEITSSKDVFETHWNYPIDIDGTVEDGDSIQIGEKEIKIIHTPGHTPGHLSLFSRSTNSLYLMDVMYWPTPVHPHPVGNTEEQIMSIKKCLSLEADYLYPGHGLPRAGSYDVEDYLKDLLLKQYQLTHRIRVVLSRHGALTVPDLHRETFPIKVRYDYAHEGWFDNSLACIQSHLRYLLNRNLVNRTKLHDGTIAWKVTSDGQLGEDDHTTRGGYKRGLTISDL